MRGNRIGIREFQRHLQVVVLFELAVRDGLLDLPGNDLSYFVAEIAGIFRVTAENEQLRHPSGESMFKNDVKQAIRQLDDLGQVHRKLRQTYQITESGWVRLRRELTAAVEELDEAQLQRLILADDHTGCEILLHVFQQFRDDILVEAVRSSKCCRDVLIRAIRNLEVDALCTLLECVSRANQTKVLLAKHIIPFPTPFETSRRRAATRC